MQDKITLTVAICLISLQVCLGAFVTSTTYSDEGCANSIGVSILNSDECTPVNCTQFEQSPDQYYKVECLAQQPAVPSTFVTTIWSADCETPELIVGASPAQCVTVQNFPLSVRISRCYLNSTAFDVGFFLNCSTTASQTTYGNLGFIPLERCYGLATTPPIYFIALCAEEEIETPVTAPVTSNTPTANPTPVLAPTSSPVPIVQPTSVSTPIAIPVTTKTPSNNLTSDAPTNFCALVLLCLTTVMVALH